MTDTVHVARPLYEIAQDIADHWTNVYFGARPYLEAMARIEKITDKFYQDTAESIVRYFLVNATTWRGEDAKRIKAELKALLPPARKH